LSATGDRRDARALGLDLGERTIGVAVSDSAGLLAVPVCTIERKEADHAAHEEVSHLVHELGVGIVVIGVPFSLDGTIGRAARRVLDESEVLTKELGSVGVKVVTHDERFTTVQATKALASAGKSSKARRKVVDSSAATVLLQAWLESGG
jgi:putative holliday junction resolvase